MCFLHIYHLLEPVFLELNLFHMFLDLEEPLQITRFLGGQFMSTQGPGTNVHVCAARHR